MTGSPLDAPWDAIIIGAGPAGGVSATLLARRGWRVLLLERAAWPRQKVCGGCINADAIALLREAGLDEVLCDAPPLDRCRLRVGTRQVTLQLPPGAAVARQEFDAAIVRAFCSAGGVFLDRASANVMPESSTDDLRTVRIHANGQTLMLQARVVLACDGIAGLSLEHEPWAAWRIAPDAWFGVAATLPTEAMDVAAGHIHMYAGRGGYVGLVRQTSGTVHLAAALDPARCKALGGPEAFVRAILHECGRPSIALDSLHFSGTGLLTRRRAGLAGHRVMAVGDACGYVEPFTGEGIAWAIRSAIDAADFVAMRAASWSPATARDWEDHHRATIGTRQRGCRMIRHALHRPWMMQAGIAIGSLAPSAADAIARLTLAHPPKKAFA